jgi:AraC-like DNA-binding protein
VADTTTRPKPRGVLDPWTARDRLELSLHAPAPDLAELVEHYWIVRWDLPTGASHPQETIPHPSVHLVVEPARSGVFGVMTGRFTRLLEGRARVLGIKFRPAGFHPFVAWPVCALTNRVAAAGDVFGAPGDVFARQVRSLDDESLPAAADAFVRGRRTASDPTVPALNQVVSEIMADQQLTRVSEVARRSGIGERRLQRLFAEYVGVRPKWVISRSRLIEAAERLATGDRVDLAALAADLGYSDQAHFARDFRAVVGRPPSVYAVGSAHGTRVKK